MSLSDLLSTTYFDNTIQAYVFFGLILLLGLLFKRLISGYLGGILYGLLGNSAHEIGRSAFDDRLKKPLNNLILLGAVFGSTTIAISSQLGLGYCRRIWSSYVTSTNLSPCCMPILFFGCSCVLLIL